MWSLHGEGRLITLPLRRRVMKAIRRICILFVLTCCLFIVQGTIVNSEDHLQECLDGCASSEGSCEASAQQSYQACGSSCQSDSIACNQQAHDDYTSCSFDCSNANDPPAVVNQCIENCEITERDQISQCTTLESECLNGPYSGCEHNYNADIADCSEQAAQCNDLCYQLWPE